MSTNAYLVDWKPAKLGGNREFYDFLLVHFENEDGHAAINKATWENIIGMHPEMRERFQQEIKEVGQDLEENGDIITYDFF